MKKHSDTHNTWSLHREKIMGLGGSSPRKTYYPELQQKLDQLERFKALLDQSNDCIFLLAVPSLAFVDFNQSACRQLNCSRAELAGLGLPGIIQPDAVDRVRELVEVGYGQGRDRDTFMTEMGMCDGGQLPVEITLTVVSFNNSLYGVAVARDITERREAEQAMVRAAKLEAQTEERIRAMEELRLKDQMMIQQSRMAAMGEMLGNIAHQWRQPLNVLGLRLQQLGVSYECAAFNRDLLEGNIADAMEILQHLSSTIDEFRRFSSPDEERNVFSVSQVIEATVAMIQESFGEQYIHIEVVGEGDPQVVGYRNEYAQALLNILMNARDVLLERHVANARVTISSGEEEGRSVVTIRDNGGGIDERIIDRIFDAYFTTKAQGKGTGVGLFLSKTIIEKNMGGCLSFRNVEGGAEFRIEV